MVRFCGEGRGIWGLTFQGEDTSLGLCFVPDVGIFLTHADHHALVTGSADDRGEDLV